MKNTTRRLHIQVRRLGNTYDIKCTGKFAVVIIVLFLALFSGSTAIAQNNPPVFSTVPDWSSSEADSTSSVTFGDVDGDGDLDLVAGNWGANRLYRNDGGVLTESAVWSSSEADITHSVAFGDVDGDGDLDLIVGNGGYDGGLNRLYRNDGGALTESAVWSSSEADDTNSVAFGDVDGDGDLDLVAGILAI